MKQVGKIIELVSQVTALSVDDIKGKKRTRLYMRARYAVSHFARLEGHSFPHIGRHMGGKDHSTIINHCERVKDWAGRDPLLDRIMRETAKAIEVGYHISPTIEFVQIPQRKMTGNDKHEARLMAAIKAAHDEVMYA